MKIRGYKITGEMIAGTLFVLAALGFVAFWWLWVVRN